MTDAFVNNNGTHAANWDVTDIQCKLDLLTLDNSLDMNMLLILFLASLYPLISAHSITAIKAQAMIKISIPIFIDHSQGLNRFSSPYLRMGQKVQCLRCIVKFVTIFHPSTMGTETLEAGNHQFWIQIGSKLSPAYPITSGNEAFYHLRKTVGHPINIYARWYHTPKYIL